MGEYNFLNDITKFGNNALSAANTLQRQVRAWVTEQVEYLIKSMELITQEELNEALEVHNKRIAELESKIASLESKTHFRSQPEKAEVKKSVAKKSVTKKKLVAKKPAAKTAKA